MRQPVHVTYFVTRDVYREIVCFLRAVLQMLKQLAAYWP